MTSPDYVIPAIVRKVDVYTVGLGLDLYLSLCLPGCPRPSVVFGYHERAILKLGRPVGDQYGIERDRLPSLAPLYGNHEIGYQRLVDKQLRFG